MQATPSAANRYHFDKLPDPIIDPRGFIDSLPWYRVAMTTDI